MNPTANEVKEFLRESNAIEREYSEAALEDAHDAWARVMSVDLLTFKDILAVHEHLMKRLRPDIAGKIRTCDVWIGGHLRRFRSVELLETQLQDVVDMLMSSFRLDDSERETACKDAHVLFETIHPFEDGNGRTGRIIYNWHRIRLGLPIHIIHEGQEQLDYYNWFK